MFRKIILNNAGFDICQRAVVVPLTFCRTTLKKECVTNCALYVNQFIKDKELIVIVSNDVYKAYFNDGTIPDLLYGKMIKEDGQKYFFFSDFRKLMEDNVGTGYDYWTRRITKEARAFVKVFE